MLNFNILAKNEIGNQIESHNSFLYRLRQKKKITMRVLKIDLADYLAKTWTKVI